MKICKLCKKEKDVSFFCSHKSRKDGLSDWCRSCVSEKNKINFTENSARNKKYREKNSESIRDRKIKYAKENQEKISLWTKNWKERNKDKIAERKRLYNIANADKNKLSKALWVSKNKEKVDNYNKNRKRYPINKERKREYEQERLKKDPVFAMCRRIKRSICLSLKNKGYTKKSRTHEILGCSFEDFKIHIESQFKDGMSWENRSEWHIDHIIPLASAKKEEDVLRLNHFSNLRPLWADENIRKKDKMPDEFLQNTVKTRYAKANKLPLTQIGFEL